jgi:hypothetical protein
MNIVAAPETLDERVHVLYDWKASKHQPFLQLHEKGPISGVSFFDLPSGTRAILTRDGDECGTSFTQRERVTGSLNTSRNSVLQDCGFWRANTNPSGWDEERSL